MPTLKFPFFYAMRMHAVGNSVCVGGLKFNQKKSTAGERGLKAFARRRRLAKAEVVE